MIFATILQSTAAQITRTCNDGIMLEVGGEVMNVALVPRAFILLNSWNNRILANESRFDKLCHLVKESFKLVNCLFASVYCLLVWFLLRYSQIIFLSIFLLSSSDSLFHTHCKLCLFINRLKIVSFFPSISRLVESFNRIQNMSCLKALPFSTDHHQRCNSRK